MSGIFGILRFDDQDVSPTDLERQARAMAHRGPDRVRRWNAGPAGLGHLQMRTQVEDAYDQQPLHAGPLSFVCDARLDNREQIAPDLGVSADALSTTPDSAITFAAYRKWGKACVERLIGDFVFAVYDRDARTLVLARDHMGQRHVLVHSGKGFFAFASEKKGLWALPEVPRELPDELIAKRLLRSEDLSHCDPRDPPADGIAAVPGGCVLTVGPDGALDLHQYWSPQADPQHVGRDLDYYVAAYRKVLQEAVECRVRRADRQPGLFFSGGFDSTSIVALAGPALSARGLKFIGASSVMPKGYEGPYHDARAAVETCEKALPHLDVRYITGEGIDLLTGLDRAMAVNDMVPGPERYINDAMYEAIAKAGSRICMDGHGGDYTLNPTGYRYLIGQLLAGNFRVFAREWMAQKRKYRCSHAGMFASEILMQLAPLWTIRFWRWRAGGVAFGEAVPLAKGFAQQAKRWGIKRRRIIMSHSKRAMMQQILVKLHSTFMIYGGGAAAVHGLEFTQPFHDKRVVELALAIPEEFHVHNGRQRYLAVTALKDVLPPAFQSRGKDKHQRAPDAADMIERVLPRVLAEIDRMEKAGKLTAYFDFPRMRQIFQQRPQDAHRANPQHYLPAVVSFQMARFVERFRGYN
ncbi:MAG TPA: asparagine synthase-related protein [Pseudolabrys sp.]|nr:asparagine synthase-related protein [Pseudolabrys sp.]